MAHVAKYPASASGHMFNHYGRSEDMERSAYVIRGNEKIDPERTHLNYNLAPDHGMSQLDFLHQRLGEVRCQKRADVNVLVDWAITMPKKYERQDSLVHVTPNQEMVERLFFERCYKFMANRYGEKNVISAYVHKDETTPHMHFAFIPVAKDKKRGGEKVSAKEVITRADLRTFHQDLERYLDSFKDWHFEVLNEATKDGNKSIAELKRETAIEEVQRQQQAAEQQIQQLWRQEEQELAAYEERKAAREKHLADLEQKADGIMSSIEAANLAGQKAFGGGLKGVTYTEYEALKRTAMRVDEVTEELAQANARADAAYADANAQLKVLRSQDQAEMQTIREKSKEEALGMRLENARLRSENEVLKTKVSRLEKTIAFLKNVIRERLPEFIKEVEDRIKQMQNPGRER